MKKKKKLHSLAKTKITLKNYIYITANKQSDKCATAKYFMNNCIKLIPPKPKS